MFEGQPYRVFEPELLRMPSVSVYLLHFDPRNLGAMHQWASRERSLQALYRPLTCARGSVGVTRLTDYAGAGYESGP